MADKTPSREPGIYYNMSFAEYLALPYYNNSTSKDVMTEPAIAWARHVDPDREHKETPAMVTGKATHVAVLEGPRALANQYAMPFEAPEDMITTLPELKEYIEKQEPNLPKGWDKGFKKADYVNHCGLSHSSAPVKELLLEQYKKQSEGKIILSPADMVRVLEMRDVAKRDYGQLLGQGYAEVTIIWDCPVTGIRCKARFDYLRKGLIIDYKTTANMNRMNMLRCAMLDIRKFDYLMQPAHYLAGVAELAAAKSFETDAVSQRKKDMTKSLLAQRPTWVWLFQMKSLGYPAIALELDTDMIAYGQAQQSIIDGAHLFKKMRERFGDKPWQVSPRWIQLNDGHILPGTGDYETFDDDDEEGETE